MCELCGPAPGWSRRRVLAAAGALTIGLATGVRPVRASNAVEILPRAAWAGDAFPAGPVSPEPDVRVLVVHHTVDANSYHPDDVVGLLQDIHRFHTGGERGWPDIAYNFIVDRFGRVWETRAGSLERPMAGDATGGNQGSDQKCAFLGDHRTEAPTPEATAAMTGLLGFLADRSGVDTRPGATTSFVSRGSNLHPAGATVQAPTITGHRTMSRTACPGDAGAVVVRDVLPPAVTAARRPSPTTTATTTSTTTAATATTATTSAVPAPAGTPVEQERSVGPAATGEPAPWPVLGVAGGAGAVVLGAALVLRGRRAR